VYASQFDSIDVPFSQFLDDTGTAINAAVVTAPTTAQCVAAGNSAVGGASALVTFSFLSSFLLCCSLGGASDLVALVCAAF
jgi:hypothetical protein